MSGSVSDCLFSVVDAEAHPEADCEAEDTMRIIESAMKVVPFLLMLRIPLCCL